MGLCVSPGVNYTPSESELQILKPPFLRSIIRSMDDAKALKATGLPLIITLNNECKEVGGDWYGWDNAVSQLLSILGNQLLVLGCGNEFDIFWNNSNEQEVPPTFAADITRRAYRQARYAGIKVAATSVAGPRWIEYLTELAYLCGGDVDYFDFHPYGKQPNGWGPQDWMFGRLEEAITQIRQLTGKDVICTEYGVKLGDAGSPLEAAKFMNAAYNTLQSLNVQYTGWFCYTDQNGAPSERGNSAFGLKSENGTLRPAWDTYMAINSKNNTPVPQDDYLKPWRGKVGDGLLSMMQKEATKPAQRVSTWLPLGITPSDIEQCYGVNGILYIWFLNENIGYRYGPLP